MAVNKYFGVVTNNDIERELMETLVIESVQVNGVDVLYIPIEKLVVDPVLREPREVSYQKTYTVEAYLPDNGETQGGQEMFEKFGIRFDERLELHISRKRFIEVTGMSNPREGDLIYIGNPREPEDSTGKSSFMNILLEIRNVIYQGPEWTLGTHYTFRVIAEAYQFNFEEFNTGVKALDQFDPDSTDKHWRIEHLDDYASNNDIAAAQDNQLVKFSRKNPLTGI